MTAAGTLYVVGTAWRINRKGHVREVESELGHALGLHVTLEGVAYPRPGEAAYHVQFEVPADDYLMRIVVRELDAPDLFGDDSVGT